jgi:TonB family protein
MRYAPGKLACVVLYSVVLFAQGPPPTANMQDAQKQGESILAKARQLSDIRSPNSPPFHLKSTFTFADEGSSTRRGSYEEFWVSSSRWRREIAVGEVKHVEVRTNSMTYVIDNQSLFPAKAKQITSAIHIFPDGSAKLNFESISNRENATPPVDCLVTKPGTWQEKLAFCFEKKSGVLLERVYPVFRGRATLSRSCDYGEFKKFGADFVPREIVCFEGKTKIISAKVDELSDLASTTPDFFSPPSGAVESQVCTGVFHPPDPISTHNLDDGTVPPATGGLVVVSVLVDVKGVPQDFKIMTPEKKKYDEAALSAVKMWRFKPATCDGEPMPYAGEIQIDSRIYR